MSMLSTMPSPRAAKRRKRDGPTEGVEPLAVLSCRAAEESLEEERKSIPAEAEAAVAERRQKLMAQLAALDEEKSAIVWKRTVELRAKRDGVLAHMKAAGGSDAYCDRCHVFYKTAEADSCSVEGCDAHLKCPRCQYSMSLNGRAVSREEGMRQRNGPRSAFTMKWDYDIWFEQNANGDYSAKPSRTGYAKCWICRAKFCNTHFREEHYPSCRSRAALRCGFRPPTAENESEGYVCFPGHCGKVLTKEDERYICHPNGKACCTISCKDCMDFCDQLLFASCGQGRCKEHAASGFCGGKCFTY